MENNPHKKLINSTHHPLENKWTLWSHLPHDTDWSMNSYTRIYTFTTVEETIAVMEILPSVVIENCMLFIMKDGIEPKWEDEKNREGGCFSYKILNKNVSSVWKELTYVVVGESIGKNDYFTNSVTGITISPKKNFCVIKIWMTDCSNQDPSIVTSELKNLPLQGCIFRKHNPE
jgi:translation initiation factor 4E